MSEIKSLDDFLNTNKGFEGYALIQCTDCYSVLKWPEEYIDLSENKLFEVRIFSKDEERRLFRFDLQDEFCYYVRNDNGLKPEEDYFDQQQILDIDTTKELEGNYVRSTGGGKYTIPKSIFGDKLGRAAILIRHYFGVAPTGQAYIKDFRCVEFRVAETLNWTEVSGGKNV